VVFLLILGVVARILSLTSAALAYLQRPRQEPARA
jgi:hypothetical protein